MSGTIKSKDQACYQDPIFQELIGNAIGDCAYDNGKGLAEGTTECDWDGTAEGCQTLCLDNDNCLSVNYYLGNGDEPHECVFHDKTCDEAECRETMDTEYYEPSLCDY